MQLPVRKNIKEAKMDSISSEMTNLYTNNAYFHLRNMKHMENNAAEGENDPIQTEDTTEEQKNNSDNSGIISGKSEHLENMNALLTPNVKTAMFALTNPKQECAGRLTPEIAPLTNLYTPIEKHINTLHPSFDYLEVVNNPHDAISEYQQSYNEFLTEAQEVVNQMKDMDNTGLLNFRFTINGPTIEMKGNHDAAYPKYKEISDWISENASALDAIAEKGAAYAYAKSEIAYQEKYGLSRDDAVHSGYEEIEKHALTITRNASILCGINPMTEAESTEKFGEPGKFTYGWKK